MRTTKTQIILRIRANRSESSLFTLRNFARMRRLIWIFAWRLVRSNILGPCGSYGIHLYHNPRSRLASSWKGDTCYSLCCATAIQELFSNQYLYMSQRTTKPTQWHVRPAKTQIRLGIRPVWSESSLCSLWVAKDPSVLHTDSEDSDQTGRMQILQMQIFIIFHKTTVSYHYHLLSIH